jgi:hypothetical protein
MFTEDAAVAERMPSRAGSVACGEKRKHWTVPGSWAFSPPGGSIPCTVAPHRCGASAGTGEPGPVLTAFHQRDESLQASVNFIEGVLGEQTRTRCPVREQMVFEGVHHALRSSGITPLCRPRAHADVRERGMVAATRGRP